MAGRGSVHAREVDELQEAVQVGVEVAHVGPDNVRYTVGPVRDVDVIAVERRTFLATLGPGLEVD